MSGCLHTGITFTACGNSTPTTPPSPVLSQVTPSYGAHSKSVPLLPIIFTLVLLVVAAMAVIFAILLAVHFRRHRKCIILCIAPYCLTHHIHTSAIKEYSPRRETIKDMMRYFGNNAEMGEMIVTLIYLSFAQFHPPLTLC